eukprot:gnl/TRDRNA2_/TRDRNA2_187821_c0_seq1.p1 gnl/TRDRNA2_/TRDRNA2_187821_c0~~gnl/TRDRNA2_/TRDRNA2_187821_c0_seq1.p1  ORF type:complete len:164 (-),score=12.13 gnl/TRDRNA2_/TRDRNA2_187821_c0_seq1:65-556(-)
MARLLLAILLSEHILSVSARLKSRGHRGRVASDDLDIRGSGLSTAGAVNSTVALNATAVSNATSAWPCKHCKSQWHIVCRDCNRLKPSGSNCGYTPCYPPEKNKGEDFECDVIEGYWKWCYLGESGRRACVPGRTCPCLHTGTDTPTYNPYGDLHDEATCPGY